jgi:hypothetical protein
MSLKSVIVNAIMKVTVENPVKNQEGAPSFEQERAYFIELLLQELFPENPAMPVMPNEVSVTVPTAPAEAPAKVKKPRAKKEKKDSVAAPVVETDSLAEPVAAPVAEPVAEPVKVKKPRAKKEKPATNAEAIIAAVDAVIPPIAEPAEPVAEPVKEKKKPGPKPKVEKDKKALNVENTPTFAKMFKDISAELKVDANKKKTLDTINAMTPEEFNAEGKTLESHLRAILAPPAAEPAPVYETQMVSLIEVEFEGKTYAVDEETKTVYVLDYDGVGKRVGTMGMNEFKGMELPPADE